MTTTRYRLTVPAFAVLLLGACATTPPKAVDHAPLPAASAENVSVQLARAEADLDAGRYDRALDGFSAVLRLDGANGRARLGLAETHLALGSPGRTMEVLSGWTVPAEHRAAAAQSMGIAELLSGDEDKARGSLTEAVRLDPSLWRAWTALAALHDRRKEWQDADRCFERAAMANPRSGAVFNNHGMSLMLRGEFDDAGKEFRRALQVEPTLKTALDNLALVTALQGQYETAMAVVPSDRLPAAMNNTGFAALTHGNLTVAEDFFSRAVGASARHFQQAEENLRWLNYLRRGAASAS